MKPGQQAEGVDAVVSRVVGRAVPDEAHDRRLELRQLPAGRRVEPPLPEEPRDRGRLLANLGAEELARCRLEPGLGSGNATELAPDEDAVDLEVVVEDDDVGARTGDEALRGAPDDP